MALTNAFYESVQKNNVLRVRIMMKDSLLFDPTFDLFHEMEKAAASMQGLYDVHDGDEFVMDSSQWNDDYMNKQMVRAVDNFSHERLEHLMNVVCFLRPVTSTQEKKAPYDPIPKSSYQEEKERCIKNGDYLGTRIAVGSGVGATIGGITGGIVASVVEAPVVGTVAAGAVVGAVAGGAAAYIINKK